MVRSMCTVRILENLGCLLFTFYVPPTRTLLSEILASLSFLKPDWIIILFASKKAQKYYYYQS